MIDWTHDLNALGANAIPQREEVVERVGMQRDMLHGARRDRPGGVPRVGDAQRDLPGVVWVLDECDIALTGELDEAVEGVLHAVHPVQGLDGTAHDVGPEGELCLHIAGRQCEMIDPSGVKNGHRVSPLISRRHQAVTTSVYSWVWKSMSWCLPCGFM